MSRRVVVDWGFNVVPFDPQTKRRDLWGALFVGGLSAAAAAAAVWLAGREGLHLQSPISQLLRDFGGVAMRYIREHAETRRGKNSAQRETPAALVFATFEHCETREKDPQLHTHTVVSNACMRKRLTAHRARPTKKLFFCIRGGLTCPKDMSE